MESLLGALKDTPIPTIMVVAGVVFLLLSIAGQLAGRITVPPERQRQATIIGCLLVVVGVALHVVPLLQSRGPSVVTDKGSPTQPAQPPKEPPSQPPGEPPRVQPPPEPPGPAATEEKEPNDDSARATVIPEGTTVHGSLGTDQDQDFIKFLPSGDKTRVLVRAKSDDPRLVLIVTVYDHVEKLLAMEAASVYRPATFAFDSSPGASYYLMVKSMGGGVRGKYELIVRQE
jgi:hypothetical protein